MEQERHIISYYIYDNTFFPFVNTLANIFFNKAIHLSNAKNNGMFSPVQPFLNTRAMQP